MVDFADGKDAGALRTIGEVSAATGVKPHVLRYWEDQFPQLKPLKRAGGRRLYRPEDVAIVERIQSLVNRQGYTLKGAEAALNIGKAANAPEPDGSNRPEPAKRTGRENEEPLLARLKAIRAHLAAALTV